MSSLLNDHRKRVGRNVKTARVSAGLTLDGLAERVGTSRQHLIRIEKGDHLPRPAMLQAIARETGTDAAQLEAEADDAEADPVSDLTNAIRRIVAQQVAAQLAEASA